MKTKLLFLTMSLIGLLSFSQNTYVPDDNFEQALINSGYDSGPLDDYVPTANINTLTYLNVGFYFIDDLTGIEDFAALSFLDCSSNNIGSLDVSNNSGLTELYCWSNPLGSLDVSNNSLLTKLHCSSNQLTSLDVSNNINLTELDCSSNSLGSLGLLNNTALENLNCSYNNLTSLDVSSLNILTFLNCVTNSITDLELGTITTLTTLYCSWNNISDLVVSSSTAMTHLYCDNNNLASLDLGNNVNLTHLLCRNNNLYSLNMSSNTALTYLICNINNLHYLDVQNGNNTNVTTFQAHDNPNLNCINVDDAAYSTSNWSTYLDPASSFSENCPALGVDEFELSTLNIFPNPAKEYLVINLISSGDYSLLNLNGQTLMKGKLDIGETTINLSNVSSGLYFLKAKTDYGMVTKKLIKL